MTSPWKRTTVNSDIEKEILTGLITDDKYIKEIQQFFRNELLQIPYVKTISKWCFEYHKKYDKAPQSDIQEIYNSHSNKGKIDETQLELIGKFLSQLSDNYEKANNVALQIDKAERYFKSRKIESLRDDLSAMLVADKIEEAEKSIGKFERVSRPSTIGIDIIRDNINHILFEDSDVLFRFPGALGDMVGDFCREDYALIAGPMKRGKSFWLQEIGLRALVRNLNVIYYSLEMSEKKMLKRIFQYFTGETKKEEDILLPFFKSNAIEYKEVAKKGLTGDSILKKRKRIEKMINNSSFRLCSFPTGSISVDDIKIHLDNLDHYNHFVPDVIIVDYADILAPERQSSKEERHRSNDTQKALRGLAQERHCLVVSASQTTRNTLSKDIDQEDIAEDVRKLAHATTVIALNQNKEDKKKNIMRVGMMVVRDDEFHVDDEVIVLECRKIGRCFLDSRWAKNVEK
jgi:replicative DNA helicase